MERITLKVSLAITFHRFLKTKFLLPFVAAVPLCIPNPHLSYASISPPTAGFP